MKFTIIFFNIKLLFNVFYLFFYVCKETLSISKVRISQKVKGVAMRNLSESEYIARSSYLHQCSLNKKVRIKRIRRKIYFLCVKFSRSEVTSEN